MSSEPLPGKIKLSGAEHGVGVDEDNPLSCISHLLFVNFTAGGDLLFLIFFQTREFESPPA